MTKHKHTVRVVIVGDDYILTFINGKAEVKSQTYTDPREALRAANNWRLCER